MRGLGYVRDVPDARDHLFAAHPASAASIISFATNDRDDVNPKNQLQTSACCGNGSTKILQLSSMKAGIDCPELSAPFAYRMALNLDGVNTDEGTQVRQVVKGIMNMGACPETDMPMTAKTDILAQPSFAAEHDAFDRRGLRGYHRIADGDLDGVRRALAAGFGLVAGWDVTEAFCSADGKDVIGAQIGPMAGGHCMGIVGYGSSSDWETRYSAFRPSKTYPLLGRIIGSWGGDVEVSGEPPTHYGYNGRIFVAPEFLEQATDIWALDVRGDAS
jgi:hypothetical protein